MKKYIFLLPYFIVVLVFFLGTSFSSGTATTVDTAIVSNTIPNVDAFNNLFKELPLVQQKDNRLPDRQQNREGSYTERAGRVPATSAPLETEVPGEHQEVDDIIESQETPEKTEKAEATEKPKIQATPATPQPTQNVEQFVRVTVSGLNVRSGPSAEHDRIDVLNLGQTVEVRSVQNDWLQVKLPNGQTGWIASRYTIIVNRKADSGNGPLAGRVIVIDPGHGGTDPGAVGITGLREKDVVLDVSLRVVDSLRAYGAKVILTRDTDIFIPLSQRVSIAEGARADLFVSVHANAHPDPQIGGVETYYFKNKTNANASFILASHLQGELAKGLGLRNIGVKHGDFLVVRQTSMPSTLVELGFLSNRREEERMRTNDFRQSAADAIVRGLQSYFR